MSFELRDPLPGDLGWVVHRHGALYHQEFGYDASFEVLVAEIAAKFFREQKPGRERCWIAVIDGRVVGSVFVVELDETTAKLRLLYVEPEARGEGLGRALCEAALNFAKASGYTRLQLWTQSHLSAARGLYERLGFQKIAEEPHHSFGKDLIAETWAIAIG